MKYKSLGFLKGTQTQDTILWLVFNVMLYWWILTRLI